MKKYKKMVKIYKSVLEIVLCISKFGINIVVTVVSFVVAVKGLAIMSQLRANDTTACLFTNALANKNTVCHNTTVLKCARRNIIIGTGWRGSW